MYLKKIVATGFKSFADKTVIELTSGISGIVGPNGSGKSNVVDAIRWVLGEQSVKSLRGTSNMTDVIFSGSKSRKEMNHATVTLIFDNTDKYLNVDYTEVSIRRRVYKDGCNEYSINGEKCRLKDVTNLFLDTGIAKESFNIISQGKVSEIITSKPVDRRVIFEEAAGVLKYKKRKEEALRKLKKTDDNLERVEDIISELEVQVNPLREQRDKAIEFNKYNEELTNVEIALITSDITKLNSEYEENKELLDNLSKELLELSVSNSKGESKVLEFKNKISKVEDEISTFQRELLDVTKRLEQVNSEKNILNERKKYEVEDVKLHNNLIELKESKLKLETDISSIQTDIKNKQLEYKDILENSHELGESITSARETKLKLEKELSSKIIEREKSSSRIEVLKSTIENNSLLPRSVKSVLDNYRLNGIHDVIGNLIEVEEAHSMAISASLSAASNFIVVDNELSAKEAIRYLKDSKLGRATFFPLNVIKSRYLDQQTKKLVESEVGYISTAAELINCEEKYKSVAENLLGNIIVVDGFDNATRIGKKIKSSYKIVTLSGELLNVGGSITGGKNKRATIITEKYELEKELLNEKIIVKQIKELENKINDSDYSYKSIEDRVYLNNKDKIIIEEFINNKNNILMELNSKLERLNNETNGIDNILNNSLSKEEEKVIEKYYSVLNQKNEIQSNLDLRVKQREELNYELDEFNFSIKKENSIYGKKSSEAKSAEIKINRIEVKLDTLLNKLSETYNMTYEKAYSTVSLEYIDEDTRDRVAELKRKIKQLGVINLGAIEEFDRINERFEFLVGQKEDLIKAENMLLEIIKEMDDTMTDLFSEKFEIIRSHFSSIFKELFRGGHADLKLSDPNNLLETGIEIVASPAGKSLKSISLLSGGEMTLTAISLLFAILKSRPVPFCVLDEVEAALDEANVDAFGEYISKFKQSTQFILITHKKKTMEYADVLYGITMQESGVSKIVSVKLEDISEKN